MTRRLLFLSFTAFAILGLVLPSCSDKTTKPKPQPCQDCLVARTSPANVLQDLRVIYGVMDSTLHTPEDAHNLALKYRELFDPEFKFYFLPGDQPGSAPEGWWGRDDEVAAFDSLMTRRALGIVTEIRLSWSPAVAVPDNRCTGQPCVITHPDWMWIHVTSILLDIVEGDITFRTSNGTADFYFAPDPADSTLWVITEWFDRETGYSPGRARSGSSRFASVAASWGRIKVLFMGSA